MGDSRQDLDRRSWPGASQGEAQLAFGLWLRLRRKNLDLTQAKLAGQIGYAAETIRKIEAGKLRPSVELAERLADQLQVDPVERPSFVRFARVGSLPPPPLPRTLGDLQPVMAPPLSRGVAAPATPLIGREKEVARLESLLLGSDSRLITLVGPPGVGKTRLALEIAARWEARFSGQVYVVALAPVREVSLVVPAIGQQLGTREDRGISQWDAVKVSLRGPPTLIVLDNFEQVIQAAPLVAELVGVAASLKVLVTSREVLRVRGERVFPVAPLEAMTRTQPDSGENPLLALAESAAVRLFVARAGAVDPDFALTPENAMAIVAICNQLDGLPLAIELAAAHSGLLTPPALLARLTHRLAFLRGGARDLPPHQQTLRDAIAWSYDLLDATERQLFARLAIFTGGWTIEAAGAVGSGGTDVLAVLEALAGKSLVVVDKSPDRESRFGMLETLREYGLERLEESGELPNVRGGHARYFCELAELVELRLRGPEQMRWLDRLAIEHDNFRAALEHLKQNSNVTGVLRLGSALVPFWDKRGYYAEGRSHLRWGLDRSVDQTTPERARALHGFGLLTSSLGEQAEAIATLEEAIQLWQNLGDRSGLAWSLAHLASVVHRQGDRRRAERLHDEALAECRAAGLDDGTAFVLHRMGVMAQERLEPVRARVLYEEALALWQKTGDRAGIALSFDSLGGRALDDGRIDQARVFFEQALSIKRQLDDRLGIAITLENLGSLAHERGDFVQATILYTEALAIKRGVGDPDRIAFTLYKLSLAAYAADDPVHAVERAREALDEYRALGNDLDIARRLAGWAAAALARGRSRAALWLLAAASQNGIDDRMSPQDRAHYERTRGAAVVSLPTDVVEAAWADGRSLRIENVLENALRDR